jgi:hypothetical protein
MKNWYDTTCVRVQGEINSIVQSLKLNEVIIICDGSEKEVNATAAWIISTTAA